MIKSWLKTRKKRHQKHQKHFYINIHLKHGLGMKFTAYC